MIPFNRTDRTGLAWNTGAAVFAALLINGLIGLVNPKEMSSYRESPLTPPGFVIGIVWTGLFACMGLARWHLLREKTGRPSASAAPVLWLAILCLAYPVYTGGLGNERAGLIGNVVTLLFTLGVIGYSFPWSRAAALWTAPVAIWLTYATFLTGVAVRIR